MLVLRGGGNQTGPGVARVGRTLLSDKLSSYKSGVTRHTATRQSDRSVRPTRLRAAPTIVLWSDVIG